MHRKEIFNFVSNSTLELCSPKIYKMKFAKIAFVSELRTIFLSLSNFWKLIIQPCPSTMEPLSSQSTPLALLPIIEARIVKIGA